MLLTAEQLSALDGAADTIHIHGEGVREKLGKELYAFLLDRIKPTPSAHICTGCLLDMGQALVAEILIASKADAEATANALENLADGFEELAERLRNPDPIASLLRQLGVDMADVKIVHMGSDAPTNQPPVKSTGTDPNSIQAAILSFFSKK